MLASTSGLHLRFGSRALRDVVELVSSMRFAISLLTVIAIASIIGTVLRQHEPFNNYVNQFGPFWAELFGALNLYAVYSAWWFLLILAFLVLSTSLCIARNTPKILADLRNFKEHVREQGLRAFHHRAQGTLAESHEAALQRLSAVLGARGWKAKAELREHGTMIAAKTGAANKLGYIAAHSAIVLVCVGGLLDGDLIVRAQMWLGDKTPYTGGGFIADVPARHRLGPGNPTFRGNLLVPEGGRSGTAILNMPDGVVLQDLPFGIELKKFVVEHYSTGMPKLFASEIIIHDHDTGRQTPATVKVNEPVFHRGIAIYQSSFDDGGSSLKLAAYPLGAGGKRFEVEGRVGESTTLSDGNQTLTLEFTGLRVINVENFGALSAGGSATDVRRVDLTTAIESRLGSGVKTVQKKELRNVGPSVTYKLRDASGQAREFHHYMLPVELDGRRVFLAGVRDKPDEPFRYLRIPADERDSIEGWLRLRRALDDPRLRAAAVRRYAAAAVAPDRPQLREQLMASATRALELFAGAASPAGPPPGRPAAQTSAPAPGQRIGGLQALADFMETAVPEAERSRTSEVLVRILNGALFELLQISREQAGLKPLATDANADANANATATATQAFMMQAVLSLSDAFFYPAPVLLQLQDFKQVQASVFQVTRTPGKIVVYLGCALLIVGVFAMLYVRERRLWIWLKPIEGGLHATLALSTHRRTLDVDREFEQLKRDILKQDAEKEAP